MASAGIRKAGTRIILAGGIGFLHLLDGSFDCSATFKALLKLALHASLENNAAQFSSIQHLKSISYECGNSICRFWCEQNHPILKPRRFTCVRAWRWSWSNHAVTIVTMCFRNLVGKIRAPRDATQYKTVLRLITPPFGRALAIVLCVLLHARGPYSWIGKTIIKHFARVSFGLNLPTFSEMIIWYSNSQTHLWVRYSLWFNLFNLGIRMLPLLPDGMADEWKLVLRSMGGCEVWVVVSILLSFVVL